MRRSLLFTGLLTMLWVSVLTAQTCTPLTYDCPSDVTFTADPGDCSVAYNYTLQTIGSCALASSTQIDGSGLSAGDFFPIGVTTQTYALEDEEGNRDTCSWTVTVVEYPNYITDDVCNAHVIVGVDSDCEVLITADMILEGGPYGCYDSFTVMIKTHAGAVVPNPVGPDYINQQLEVSVTDRHGNSCWGYLTVEDKTVPALSCTTIEVACTDPLTPHTDPMLGLPFPLGGTGTVAPSGGAGPFTVSGYDGCGTVTLSYVDQVDELDCTVNTYTRIINRTWTATDVHGNTTTCTDVIQVLPSMLSDLQFPDRDGTDAPALLCSGNWDANGDDIPQPDEIGDIADAQCDAWASYTDIIHTSSCGTLIHRDWNILHKCSGTNLDYTQVIRIVDDVPPTIQCPSVLNGSTNIANCKSNYHVPPPTVLADACSGVTYEVEVLGQLVTNSGTADHPHFIVHDLMIGDYTLIYTAVDGCGLTASCTTNLSITDQTPPMLVCDPSVKAYVLLDQDSIHVDRLYTLAQDECGVDRVLLRRRVTGPCLDSNSDDLVWHEVETFCCEEIGQYVQVEVGVWDIHGNMTTCLTVVYVSGDIPGAKCPPDITVSCAYPIDLDDLSVFGEIRFDPDDVRDIMIDDPAYQTGCKMINYSGPMKWGKDPLYDLDCDIDVRDSVVDLRICGQSRTIDGEVQPGLRRYFIFEYNGTEVGRCHQDIFVLNCGGDVGIVWPADTFTFYCSLPIDSMFGGLPTTNGGGCGAYTYSFVDMEVPGVGDTCSQVLRTWTAMDTCQQDTMITLTYVQQFFVLYDNDLQIQCQDTIMIDPSEPCGPVGDGDCARMVALTAPDVMSCDTLIAYRYEVDLDAAASSSFEVDVQGDGSLIDEILPVGWHEIRWLAQDGCRGRDTCSTLLFVPPCGSPEIVCQDAIVILSDTNGLYIDVTASIDTILNDCGAGITGYLVCDSADLAGLDSVRLLSGGGPIDIATALEALSQADTCFLSDSLLIDCDDVAGTSNTLFYEVWLVQGMDTSVCEARIIVEDTGLVCNPEACDLVYGITSGGDFYSINTDDGSTNFVMATGVLSGTNAVAVNADLGLGYFASDRTVFWIDLISGQVGTVGDLNSITGSLTNAAASYWRGHYYCGPETGGSDVEDIYRVELAGDGRSFVATEVNLSNGNVPTGNFGDFIVLDGMIGEERIIMSLFDNFSANDIIEYTVETNTFTTLFSIASPTSSQITIDNLDRIWYFDNLTNAIGILDLNTGTVSSIANVGFTFSDLGRSYCPPEGQSIYSSTDESDVSAATTELKAIPNPFDTETSLALKWDQTEQALLTMYDMQGRVVMTQTVQLVEGDQQIAVSLLHQGVFIAQLQTSEGVLQCRLISE